MFLWEIGCLIIYVYKYTEGQESIKSDHVNDTKALIKTERWRIYWKEKHEGIFGHCFLFYYINMQQNNLNKPKYK